MSNSELNASIRLNLSGNLIQQSQRFNKSMKGMARETRLSFQIMQQASQKTVRMVNSGLDSMSSRYAMFTASLAGGISFKNAVTLERRMTQIGINADLSTKQVKKLQDEVYKTAMDKNIAVDPSEMLAAIEEIVARTGDLDYARRNMEALGKAIQATGSTGGDIGGLVAELKKLDIQDVDKALNLMVGQGKVGAIEMKDLAGRGPQLLSAYASTGRTGNSALMEMGAAIQVIKDANFSAETAATTFDSILRDVTDPAKQKKLYAAGIDIYEKDANGNKVMRSLPVLMSDITTKLHGDMSRIGTIFGDESRRGFNILSKEFRNSGKVTAFDKYSTLDMSTDYIGSGAARGAATAAGGLQRLSTSWNYFINNQLNEPLNDLADTLHDMNTETVQSIYNIGKWIATVGAATAILHKSGALRGGAWLYRTLRNKKNSGLGGLDGMMSKGVQRVFVVNLPGATSASNRYRANRSDIAIDPNSPSKEPQKPKSSRWEKIRNSRAGRFGAKLSGPGGSRLITLANAGIQTADAVASGGKASDVGSVIGGLGGGIGGEMLGGMIGQALIPIPGLGFVIGGAVGGLLGSIGGSMAGDAVGEQFETKDVQGEIKVSIEDNRTRVTNVSSNSPGMTFTAGSGADLGYWGGQ